MLYHSKLGLSQVEARLVEFKAQEIKFCEKIRGLEFNVGCKNNRIERLTNELEELKKDKEGLESKVTGFESSAKDLDTLLQSQRSDKNNEGLGYSDVPPSCSKSNSSDLQNNNSSVSKHRESSESIMSKPMIKFVKAADCADVKTNKVEAARKPSVKYAEMYRNTHKSPKRNKGKAVKASACWIWRPIQNTTEKCPNCNSVSVIFKKYQYIDTQGRLKSVMAWVPKKV
nr:ubiquitin hydrolase [Tanacetum cinerariifolium]